MAKQDTQFVIFASDDGAYMQLDVQMVRRRHHELTADEMKIWAVSAKRNLSAALSAIRWGDFGIENIKIRNKRRPS